MVSGLVERITRQNCGRCGGELHPDEIERFHVTFACWVCGYRKYVSTAPEMWL